MNKTKNEVATQTALTVDELKKMGEILGDMGETIELYNHAINLAPDINNIKEDGIATYYRALYDLTSTMFRKNQGIINSLDDVSYILLENDNAFEIQNTRKKFN